MKRKFIFALAKGFDGDGLLTAVASSPAIDRYNEVIDAAAWKDTLPLYRTNPVILATHLHRTENGSSPVIGSARKIELAGEQLTFTMAFASTALGKEYETLFREGHMRAFSVGFMPIAGAHQPHKAADGSAQQVYHHTAVELLEISAVPVPANPEALARACERAMMDAADCAAHMLQLKMWMQQELDDVRARLPEDVDAELPDGDPDAGADAEHAAAADAQREEDAATRRRGDAETAALVAAQAKLRESAASLTNGPGR